MTILDLATVQAEFSNTNANVVVAPRRPHIAGPEAKLRRYTNAAEKALARLGSYNYALSTDYNWPNLPAGGIVDLSFAKLYIEGALIRYYLDQAASGDALAPVAGYKNRIATAGTQGFVTNTATYPRKPELHDRDVKVGDVVKIVYNAETLWTSVAGLIPDSVAGVVGTAAADTGNPVSQPNSDPATAPTVNVTGGGAGGGLLGAGTYYVRYTFVGTFGESTASDAVSFTAAAGNIPRVTLPALPTGAASIKLYLSPVGGNANSCTLYRSGITTTTTDLTTDYVGGGAAFPKDVVQTSGTVNNVTPVLDNSLYNGAAAGDIVETYTITVIQAPLTPGNATTALLKVVSASGHDDVASFAPAAYGAATSIGTRGTKITFSTSGGQDFVLNQVWQTTVRQAWTSPVPTSSGTYSGTNSTTYLIRVSLGGLYADATKPQITVTTVDNSDVSGPTNVTAAASNVAVGTKGVQIQFSGTGLRKGDLYAISVAGVTAGAYKTILLNNDMSATMAAATDLTVSLYAKKDIEVDPERVSAPPTLNWQADQDGLTVNSGILAYDSSITSNGALIASPVEGGTLYAHYRAWLPDHAEAVAEAVDEADVLATFGYVAAADIDADNPLAYGVLRAVQASNGQGVKFTAIADPSDVSQWTDMLKILEGDTTVAELVPLSKDSAVQDGYIAHIRRPDLDDNILGEWKHAWFSLDAPTDKTIVSQSTASDHNPVLATIADNPSVAGTQYTLLASTSGNAKFVTNGVQAGDVVRYLYGVDAFGTETHQEFSVGSVINEDSLLLQTANNVAVSTPQRVEIHRNLTKTQSASELAASMTGTKLNRNLRYVWPDKITDDAGNEVEGYYLCAAYAAAATGIVPQQGLGKIAIPGFTKALRSTNYFNAAQLNVLKSAGFFVVTANTAGQVYAVATGTPDPTDTASKDEAMVRRDDSIKRWFFERLDQFRNLTNINADVISHIDVELKSAATEGPSSTRVDRIGAMFNTASVTSITQHPTMPDRLVVAISVNRDTVLNETQIEITF